MTTADSLPRKPCETTKGPHATVACPCQHTISFLELEALEVGGLTRHAKGSHNLRKSAGKIDVRLPGIRQVDVRLPGKGSLNSRGARPVHIIITKIK